MRHKNENAAAGRTARGAQWVSQRGRRDPQSSKPELSAPQRAPRRPLAVINAAGLLLELATDRHAAGLAIAAAKAGAA